MGHPARIYVEETNKDVNGREAGFGHHGWYYKWWRGIHLLCGEEGFDEDFQIRPSHEDLKPMNWAWKRESYCVKQLNEDGYADNVDGDDDTPALERSESTNQPTASPNEQATRSGLQATSSPKDTMPTTTTTTKHSTPGPSESSGRAATPSIVNARSSSFVVKGRNAKIATNKAAAEEEAWTNKTRRKLQRRRRLKLLLRACVKTLARVERVAGAWNKRTASRLQIRGVSQTTLRKSSH